MAGGRRASSASSASPASSSASSSASSAPVRVFPPSAAAARALQALPADPAGVAAVGILGSGRPSAALALANRVVGRRTFHGAELEAAGGPSATIHLFYDASRRCVYLLGLARGTNGAEGTNGIAGAEGTNGMEGIEAERLKMQTLLLASCSLVFVLRRGARTSTLELGRVRALAAEKARLLQWQSAAGGGGGKPGKRSAVASSALAPGRCVPVAVFVVPAASDALLRAAVPLRPGVAPSSGGTRSATAAHGKAVEARLAALFRSLRGGPVGSARLRDALVVAAAGKERRVFTMDPSHSVVVISRRALEGPEARLRAVLDASSDSETESEGSEGRDGTLEPLGDDDAGWPRAAQYQQRVLDHLAALQAAGGAPKDARTELLPLPQWLRAFHALVKLYQRMDGRRRGPGTAGPADREAE